jgi:hypothetical protein
MGGVGVQHACLHAFFRIITLGIVGLVSPVSVLVLSLPYPHLQRFQLAAGSWQKSWFLNLTLTLACD